MTEIKMAEEHEFSTGQPRYCHVCGKRGTKRNPVGTAVSPNAGMDKNVHEGCAFKR